MNVFVKETNVFVRLRNCFLSHNIILLLYSQYTFIIFYS